jgi:hypothetical protein
VAKGSAERVLDLIHRRTRANCGVSVARKRLRRRRRHQCVSAYLRTSEYLCVSAYLRTHAPAQTTRIFVRQSLFNDIRNTCA